MACGRDGKKKDQADTRAAFAETGRFALRSAEGRRIGCNNQQARGAVAGITRSLSKDTGSRLDRSQASGIRIDLVRIIIGELDS